MTTRVPRVIRLLRTDETVLAGVLADLVNGAYTFAQTEIFVRATPRTSAVMMSTLIADGGVLVAQHGEDVVGLVHVRDLEDRRGFFGMLAVAPSVRSVGVARDLLDEVEARGDARGLTAMELDLLMPDPPTAHQSRLREWYERRGYLPVASRSFSEIEPDLAAHLRHPTALIRYAKRLTPAPSPDRPLRASPAQ